jgi:predicted amidohydrolase
MAKPGSSESLTVGMGQMRVDGGEVAANLARAVAMIEAASCAGCDVVVLPECLNTGWTHPSAHDLATALPGRTSEALQQAAVRTDIWVVAGLVERDGEHLHNSALLISPEGEIVLRHRKINELDIGRGLYTPGTSLQVADTALGRVGLTICADNFPESLELSRSLARMGAEWIFSPCAWAVEAQHDNQLDPYGGLWETAYSTLTRECDVTIVGVSNVGWLTAGPWEGRKCIGCSMAYGPGGRRLAQAPYGDHAECLLTFVAPRARAAGIRKQGAN